MTWLRQNWVWALPLSIVVLSSALLSTYRTVYSGRVGRLEEAVREQQRENESQRLYAAALEAAKVELEAGTLGVGDLYENIFATESKRFTALSREIKDLAQRCGMELRNIQYPEQRFTEFGLIRRRVNFSVRGSYLEVRRFINLLELSETFIVVERISVSDAEQASGELQVSFSLSSLFAGRDGFEEPEES